MVFGNMATDCMSMYGWVTLPSGCQYQIIMKRNDETTAKSGKSIRYNYIIAAVIVDIILRFQKIIMIQVYYNYKLIILYELPDVMA